MFDKHFIIQDGMNQNIIEDMTGLVIKRIF